MNRATGLVGRALLLAALCAPAAAAVRGDGADCGRLLAAPQRSTWIWHPADPQRGVLVVDDGRVLAITREITAATTGQVPAAARLAWPWPEADCPGSALPPPDLPLTLPEGAAAALVDAVAQAEDHETAARRPRGLEERAEHWRAALERLRSVWTDVGATGQAVLERLAAHALMAAADGGALPARCGAAGAALARAGGETGGGLAREPGSSDRTAVDAGSGRTVQRRGQPA